MHNSNLAESDCSASIIIEPHSHDVLFGRGNQCTQHPGNVLLRQLLLPRKNLFVSSSPDARKRLVYQVYAELRQLDPPPRFLTRQSSSNSWIQVSEEKAIMKM